MTSPANGTSLMIDEGLSFELECIVARALPAADILWYKDNKTPSNIYDDISILATNTGITNNTDRTYSTTSKLRYIATSLDNGMRIYCGNKGTAGVVMSAQKPLLDIKCKFVR